MLDTQAMATGARKQHTHTRVHLGVNVCAKYENSCGKSEKGKIMVVLAVQEGVRFELGKDRT